MGATLTTDDLGQIAGRGMQVSDVEKQLENFLHGFPPIPLVAAATTKRGIQQLSLRRIEELIELYEEYVKNHKVIKFVPASGAASRMFKHLYEFRSLYRGTSEDQLELLKDRGPDSVYYFFEHIQEFSFFPVLLDALENRGLNFETVMEESRYEKILNTMLTDRGLGFGELPKALIPFHTYGDEVRTAFAEHLSEAAYYAISGKGQCYIHFTSLPQHVDLMEAHFAEIKKHLEEKFNIRYHVSYSIQEPSTDVIAVDGDNNPVRVEKGALVFRPGGHGALLQNLSNLDGDLIIIKNIDNVCHDRFKEDTYLYKKVLAGYLIALQDQMFSFLNGLDNPTQSSMKVIDSMLSFVENKLNITPPPESDKWKKEEKIDYLRRKLNRPIRVCGMVENEGEPGGGPFWVKNYDDSISLQIVEASQIDRRNPEQELILQNSTHFNPVDLVCSTRNYRGELFNLPRFTDPETGLITEKSIDGKIIRAQELPGLWNGSMSDWNTIFVEVPLTTFNPVKIINDLLRPEHREFQ
ncbi:MAG: DUF4301 family protein [Bacteroidales bacterium]